MIPSTGHTMCSRKFLCGMPSALRVKYPMQAAHDIM